MEDCFENILLSAYVDSNKKSSLKFYSHNYLPVVVAGAAVLPNPPNPPVLAGSVLLAEAPNEKVEDELGAFELLSGLAGFEPVPPAPKVKMPLELVSFLGAAPNENKSLLGAEASNFLVSVLAMAAPKSNEGGALEAVVTAVGAKLNVEDAVVLDVEASVVF